MFSNITSRGDYFAFLQASLKSNSTEDRYLLISLAFKL